jgi:hypothetical protein
MAIEIGAMQSYKTIPDLKLTAIGHHPLRYRTGTDDTSTTNTSNLLRPEHT